MFAALTSVVLALAVPSECPMHKTHAAAASPVSAVQSPYAGEESRPIKALSEADEKAYREGTGMGMAKPAELNQYPGPRHVLDLADALQLSPDQKAGVEASFRRMKTAAVPLGEQVIDAERNLDALFAGRAATPEAVARLVGASAELQGRLRAVHLQAHLEMRDLLTAEQVARYGTLRGYGHAGHHGH